jgi:hypothetical protein
METERPGELARIGTSDRLSIPVEVLRAVEWWDGKSVEVLGESVHEGLVRIYLAREAEPLVQSLIGELSELPPAIRFDRTAVIADRYRRLKLSSDGRLQFTKETAHVLGFSLGERPVLFVQAFPKGLEILSLTLRLERLRTEVDATSIQLRILGLG